MEPLVGIEPTFTGYKSGVITIILKRLTDTFYKGTPETLIACIKLTMTYLKRFLLFPTNYFSLTLMAGSPMFLPLNPKEKFKYYILEQ